MFNFLPYLCDESLINIKQIYSYEVVGIKNVKSTKIIQMTEKQLNEYYLRNEVKGKNKKNISRTRQIMRTF